MSYKLTKSFVKAIYTNLTVLNKKSVVVFSDYSKQLGKIIKQAAFCNRVYFLPEKHGCFDFSNITEFNPSADFNYHVNLYKDYFKKVKCNFFIINSLPRGDIDRHAALVAAKESDVKIAYFDHGDTGFEDPSAIWHWLYFADFYYTCNIESRIYVNDLKHQYKETCYILEWQRPLLKRKKQQRYIVFAPGFYNGELFIGLLTDTAKYKFIETIVKQLNAMGFEYGYRILYKTVDSSHESLNPRSIDRFKEYEAVEYVDGKDLNKLVSKASAFITDCVSTPLYDAVDMKVPSLCLYNSGGAKLKMLVKDWFGDAIRVCSKENDIIESINSFFASNFSLGSNAVVKHGKPDPMPWEENIYV